MLIGIIALVAYASTVPVANWMVGNVGIFCIPNGPCVLPVFPGIYCPSGSLMIGLALVLRDIVQRALGAKWSLGAIIAGTAIAALIAPPALVTASALSFLISELVDFGVYTPLYRKRFITAIVASSIMGLIVDSILFLLIAFGSLDLLPGIILGKLWMVLLALPFMMMVKQHFQRIEGRYA